MNKFKIADINNRIIHSFRPMDEYTLKSLRDYYRIGLTFSSNALEGNSLTESETKVIIENGLTVEGKPLIEIYEAIGHAESYDFLYQIVKKKELTEQDIFKIHQLFYYRIDNSRAGKYRSIPVFISGSNYSVTSPNKIEMEMKKFIKWYNSNENKIHPIELAAKTHLKFVKIHPFIDGNGRVARLLMNFALLRNDFSIAIIPSILRHTYINALEKSHKDESQFIDFIADSVINTQSDLIKLLRSSGGVINKNGGVKDVYIEYSGGVKSKSSILLEIIRTFPGINTPGISLQVEFSLRTIQRILKQLVEENQIKFFGAPKNGGYFLQENL